KNTLKTEEQINIANEVNQEVKDLIVQQNSKPWVELTPANPIKPTEPEAKPDEPVKKDEIPWVELTPANPTNKNEVPWTELKPAVSKYFDNSDKGTYYYGNNQADTKTSAELNLNNVSLSLYNRELNADKSVKAFDAYYLDGTANTINAQRYNNNSIKPASIDEETHNLSNSSITNPEGKNNLAYNSNYASFEANKNELKAQLLGLNYDLAKSDLEHFTTLRDDWNSFKDSVNQNNQDYSNYYVGNNSLAKLDFKNNTLTYYSKKSNLKDGRDEYGLKQVVIHKDFLQRKEFDAKDLEYESFKMLYVGPAYIQDSKDTYKLDAIINKEHISYSADRNNLIMSISDIQDSLNVSNINDFNAKLSSWENDRNMFFEKFYVNPTKEFYYAKGENYVKLKPSDSYFASYNKLDNVRSILFELDKNNLLGIYNKNNNIIKINPNVTPYLKVEDSEYKVNITSQDADKTSIVLKATPNDATLKINSNINGDLINVKVDDLQKTLEKDKINNLIKDLKTK
ncbi:hypothetical protein AVANS14531_09030, partial [Campylobacter sp. Cr9]|uniref:hypothetical protein n=1 Tax=Campylobacter sp. Cr9 TaxID=2735728 RepID=UPI003014458F|nr:hypothetical protein [Campylobacter sp. Cr9]